MSNRVAREKLETLFGARCFIEKLHLRKEDKGIRRRFKGSKKRRKNLQKLTYHHIIEKHFGGETTVENGALLSEENHEWFHKQPISDQIKMDKKFQKYKIRILKKKGLDKQFQGEFEIPHKNLYRNEIDKQKNKKNAFKKSLKCDNIYDEGLPPRISRAKRKANDREIYREYLER